MTVYYILVSADNVYVYLFISKFTEHEHFQWIRFAVMDFVTKNKTKTTAKKCGKNASKTLNSNNLVIGG